MLDLHTSSLARQPYGSYLEVSKLESLVVRKLAISRQEEYLQPVRATQVRADCTTNSR